MTRFLTRKRLILDGIILVLIFFLLNPLGILNTPHLTEIHPHDSNKYYLRIDAHQWGYNVVDPFLLDGLISEGMDQPDAYRESILTQGSSVNLHFDVGLPLHILFHSRDVHHGLAIDKIDFKISAHRPGPGEPFGVTSLGVIQLAEETTELRGYEFIDFGLGARDMEIIFYVGDTYGIEIVWSIIMISVGMLILIAIYYVENFNIFYGVNPDLDLYPEFR